MPNASDAQNDPSVCPVCGCRGGGSAPPDTEQLRRWLGEPVARRIGLHRLPPELRLSVVIPVYNEKDTMEEIVRRVRAVPIPKEIILVDDGSTDGTREMLATLDAAATTCEVLYHERNRGKGAALRTGFAAGHRRHRHRPGRRPGVRPSQYPAADPADRRGRGRRGLRLAVHGRRAAPRALLLALRGQPRADHALEHVHRPEPDRHGDLLQGLPPRGDRGHPAHARSRTASASSRR